MSYYIVVDRGDLENPENGAVSLTGTTLFSVATYSCYFGFFLNLLVEIWQRHVSQMECGLEQSLPA